MNATPILPGLSPVAGKPLTATFDAPMIDKADQIAILYQKSINV